jgi:uncharacterized protein (TIGR02996 family)
VNDLRALIDGVRDRPADHGAKLVLADYLRDRGNEWAANGLRLLAELNARITPYSCRSLPQCRWKMTTSTGVTTIEATISQVTFEGALFHAMFDSLNWRAMRKEVEKDGRERPVEEHG